jgi:hypothetical protein
MYVGGGALTIQNSTIADNVSTGFGLGGAGGAGGSGVTGGSGGAGGSSGASHGVGMYIAGGSVTSYNMTVALNLTGVYQVGGTADLFNSLFANNGYTPPGGSAGDDYDNVSGSATASHSLFGTPPLGVVLDPTDIITVNAELDPAGLASNGGPTQTIALLSTSPARGAGQNPINGVTLTTDQRGFTPSPNEGWDIGAYQFGASPALSPPPSPHKVPVSGSAPTTAPSNPASSSVTIATPAPAAGTAVPVDPPQMALAPSVPESESAGSNAVGVMTTAAAASTPLTLISHSLAAPGHHPARSHARNGRLPIVRGPLSLRDRAHSHRTGIMMHSTVR